MEKFKIQVNELPSIYKEPDITSTIKANPFKSNVEIEGKEKVLSPDLTGIYTAVGNRHSKGGMDVYLPPDSFVFSDYKDMAISPEEHDRFQLKKGGSSKPIDNTPSKVIGRNIDTKHYNKMTSIVQDNKKSEIDKRTAMLMLNKYGETLGRVAYLQESKKNFPDGVPEFAKDTAPVIDNHLKDEIMQNKQYMKWGGKTRNPYSLPKAQSGIRIDNSGQSYTQDANGNWNPDTGASPTLNIGNPIANSNNVNLTPNNLLTPYQGDNTWKGNASQYSQDEINTKLQSLGYNGPNNAIDAQKWLMNSPDYNGFVKHYHSTDGPNDQFSQKGFGIPNGGTYNDGKWGHRWDAILNDASKWNGDNPPPSLPVVGAPSEQPINDPGPNNAGININPQRMGNPNYGWTNDMKRTTALAAYNAASIQKGKTYRSQINTPLVELERVNPQAALNNADNASYRASQSMRGMNPYLAAGQNASTFGQTLDAKNQIQGQYGNENAGIANQQNEQNVQAQDQEARMNTGFDQQFFKDNELNNAHYANAKQVAWNNVNDNVNSNNLQVNRVKYFNASLSPNSPYYLSNNRGNYDPVANPNRSILGVRNPFAMNEYEQNQQLAYLKQLQTEGHLSPGEAATLSGHNARSKAFAQGLPQNMGAYPQQPQNPFGMKRGGRMKRNPYKK